MAALDLDHLNWLDSLSAIPQKHPRGVELRCAPSGVQPQRLQHCPNYSMAMHTTPDHEGRTLVTRLRCKAWTCDYCAGINSRVWQRRIMLHVQAHPAVQWYFATLTLSSDRHNGDAAESFKAWQAVWNRLWTDIARRWPPTTHNAQFLRVYEPHKDGTLHLHMITNVTPPEVVKRKQEDGRPRYHSALLESRLKHYGLGWVHDWQPIKPTRGDTDSVGVSALVAAYVAKYMTKAAQGELRGALDVAGIKRARMISTSRGWTDLPKVEGDYDWNRGAVRIMAAAQQYGRPIETIYDLQHKTLVSVDRLRRFQWQSYPDLEGEHDHQT